MGKPNVTSKTLKAPKASKFRGVYKCGKKWKSQIQIQGQQIYLGVFDSEVEAAEKFNDAVKFNSKPSKFPANFEALSDLSSDNSENSRSSLVTKILSKRLIASKITRERGKRVKFNTPNDLRLISKRKQEEKTVKFVDSNPTTGQRLQDLNLSTATSPVVDVDDVMDINAIRTNNNTAANYLHLPLQAPSLASSSPSQFIDNILNTCSNHESENNAARAVDVSLNVDNSSHVFVSDDNNGNDHIKSTVESNSSRLYVGDCRNGDADMINAVNSDHGDHDDGDNDNNHDIANDENHRRIRDRDTTSGRSAPQRRETTIVKTRRRSDDDNNCDYSKGDFSSSKNKNGDGEDSGDNCKFSNNWHHHSSISDNDANNTKADTTTKDYINQKRKQMQMYRLNLNILSKMEVETKKLLLSEYNPTTVMVLLGKLDKIHKSQVQIIEEAKSHIVPTIPNMVSEIEFPESKNITLTMEKRVHQESSHISIASLQSPSSISEAFSPTVTNDRTNERSGNGRSPASVTKDADATTPTTVERSSSVFEFDDRSSGSKTISIDGLSILLGDEPSEFSSVGNIETMFADCESISSYLAFSPLRPRPAPAPYSLPSLVDNIDVCDTQNKIESAIIDNNHNQ